MPEDLTAEISGIVVRVVDLSLVGAKVHHTERFPLTSPQLKLRWHGGSATLAARAARSEIVGREQSQLLYSTGLSFGDLDAASRDFIASILDDAPTGPPPAAATPPAQTFDDSWTRQIQFLHDDLDEGLPFARFRLTDNGWQKDYTSTPAQPEDGFTISADRLDFDEMQRTFEAADPDTRRMMQIALTSELTNGPRQ